MSVQTYFRWLAAVVFSVALGCAQSSTGDINVMVTDPSEAAVVGAKITITGAEKGAVVRTLPTNNSGLAQAALLNPGTYDIRVEKEGFKTIHRTGIVLRVTDVLRLQVVLEVGTASQSVTITGEAPLVETDSNAQGQVISNATIQQLPLNGRNIFSWQ